MRMPCDYCLVMFDFYGAPNAKVWCCMEHKEKGNKLRLAKIRAVKLAEVRDIVRAEVRLQKKK